MNIAKIQVSGVQAVAADAMTKIPAGIVGATVQMEYTGDIWAGLNKAVIFRGNTTREVLTNENTVTVPAEVLAEPRGRLRVGVYGTDAANNVIMPTMWAEVGVIADAAAPADPSDSSLPVWAQLWAMIGNLSNLDTDAKSSLVSAINEILAKTEGTPDWLVVTLDLATMTASHSSTEVYAAKMSGKPFALVADGIVMDIDSISADSVKFYHNAILPPEIRSVEYNLDASKRIIQTSFGLAKTVPNYSISDSGKTLEVVNGKATWVRNPNSVKTVNGTAPDENGNVDIEAPSVEDVLAALPTVTNVTVTDHGDGRFTQVKEFSDGSEEVTEVTVDENGIPVKLTVNGVEIPYFFRYGGDDPGVPDEPEIPDDPVIPDEPGNYLTFASAEPFTIGVNNATKNWDGVLEYSTDTAVWNEWDGATAIASAEHGGEQKIYMRGSGNSVISENLVSLDNVTVKNWVSTGNDIRCVGNIENLLDYQTVANGEHPPMGDLCFHGLFNGMTSLKTSPELPATELSYGCYNQMFRGCTGLTFAPELPATELDSACYLGMFRGCTGLTVAPKLPAESVASSCYQEMFSGCTGLVEAPELPAKILASQCYESMFSGCTSLTMAVSLPATTLAVSCYKYMFYGCGALTAIPSLPATALPNSCYRYMFMDCANVKISETQSEEYPNEYRIPANGEIAEVEVFALHYMFEDTGGTFEGTPNANTTYYTANEVIPAGKLVGYKYGAISDVLPDIESVWDKAAHPYAGIHTSLHLLIVSDLPLRRDINKSVLGYTFEDVASNWVRYQLDGSGENWVRNGGGYGSCPTMCAPLWVNYDMYNTDGTLYLAATEPIPVYE